MQIVKAISSRTTSTGCFTAVNFYHEAICKMGDLWIGGIGAGRFGRVATAGTLFRSDGV